MNDPRRMRRIQRVGDLNRKRQQQIDFQWTSGDAVLQHHPIQKLDADERLAGLLAYVINRADVGMVQCRCSLSFASKARQHQRVAGNVFGQKFERDKTLQPDVFCLVDHAHAAAPEFLDDAVVRDGLADQEKTQLRERP